MFRKVFILMAAACALAACESQSGSVITGPLAKTGTAMPAQEPVSYMVFFSLGSTRLSDQDQNTVAQAAQVFKTKQNARVTVTGYTDTVGSPQMNQQLGQARANVVKAGLVKNGVPSDAISTSTSGESGLLVDTGDQTNEARNRRVVIVIQ